MGVRFARDGEDVRAMGENGRPLRHTPPPQACVGDNADSCAEETEDAESDAYDNGNVLVRHGRVRVCERGS